LTQGIEPPTTSSSPTEDHDFSRFLGVLGGLLSM
jgi:hypothetical protein